MTTDQTIKKMFFFGPLAVSSAKANLNVSYYNHLWSSVPGKYKRYWEWFFAYSQVPRQSRHHDLITKATVDWLVEVGIPRESITIDEGPNVLARIPASKGLEDKPTICVQGHMDVALHNKAEDVPYRVIVNKINGKNWFTANETLLGADDGFATALMLLIAEQRDDFQHGPIELLFTSDEEIGLVGMNFLPGPENKTHGLRANSIVNIDFFDANKMAIGTAGSIRFELRGNRSLIDSPIKQTLKIMLTDMIGGHSGINMINGRITPQEYYMRFLGVLDNNKIEYYIQSYTSGDAANVLPSHGEMVIFVKPEDVEKAIKLITDEHKNIEAEYPNNLGKSTLNFEKNTVTSGKCLSKEDTQKFMDAVLALHHGIVYFVDTTIYTSQNIARIDLVPDGNSANVTIHIMPRTHIQRHLDFMRLKMKSFARTHGIAEIIEHSTSNPWFGDENSTLYKAFTESYKHINEADIQPVLFHAGTEAGRFAVRGYTNASVINFGSDIINAHTVGESIKISTTNKQVDVFFECLQRFVGIDPPPITNKYKWVYYVFGGCCAIVALITITVIVVFCRSRTKYNRLSASIISDTNMV